MFGKLKSAVVGAVLTVACGLSGTTTVIADDTVTTIRYGFLPFPVAPVFAAKAHGFFEKHGIELEMTKFTSGPAEFQALQAGSIDIAHGALAAFYMASSRGLDAKWVYAFGDNSGQGGLMVPEGSDVNGPADFSSLAGKKVAAPSGSILHLLHLVALRQADMSPEDIEFVSLAPPQAVAALKGGDVDAAWMWDPFVTAAKKHGAKVAFTNKEIGGGDIFGLTVNADWLAQDGNREALARLFAAFEDGLAAYADDPTKTLDEVERTLGLDRDLASRLMAGVDWFTIADQLSPGSVVSIASPDDTGTGARQQASKIEEMALWGNLIEKPGTGAAFFDPSAAMAASGQ